jgi:hypothetical protein
MEKTKQKQQFFLAVKELNYIKIGIDSNGNKVEKPCK